MQSLVKKVLLCALVCASCVPAIAGDGYRKFDEAIRRMLMSGMDTNYVSLPKTSWEVPFAANYALHSSQFLADGQQLNLNPQNVDAGITIGYHGLDLFYTFSLNKKAENFYIDYYDNYWGISFNLGNYALNVNDPVNCDLRTHSLLVSGYYAFNGSQYSHPATAYCNYIQNKTAGSPLLFAWYDYHSARQGDVALPGYTFDETGHLYKVGYFAIAGGYGENFAFKDGRYVLNLSCGIGVACPLALAVRIGAGAVAWITDNLRISATATYYRTANQTKLGGDTIMVNTFLAYHF